ncbi:MAG: hypothetical protein V3V78_05025 [Candidatus Woesearchaeota archaeon]
MRTYKLKHELRNKYGNFVDGFYLKTPEGKEWGPLYSHIDQEDLLLPTTSLIKRILSCLEKEEEPVRLVRENVQSLVWDCSMGYSLTKRIIKLYNKRFRD